MGFLFGLLIGSSLSGSSPATVQQMLGSIPLRCVVALEDGDDAYRSCRRLSLAYEMYHQVDGSPDDVNGHKHGQLGPEVEAAMNLEIRALKEIETAAKAAQVH